MVLKINSSLDVHAELAGDDRSGTLISSLACLLDLNLCVNVYYSISSNNHLFHNKDSIYHNALRRKLKLTDYFENKQNFAPVFLEISKFRPF